MEDPLTPCVNLAEFLLSRHTWYRPVLHLYCSQEYRDYKIANIFAKISQAFIFWQKAKCRIFTFSAPLLKTKKKVTII